MIIKYEMMMMCFCDDRLLLLLCFKSLLDFMFLILQFPSLSLCYVLYMLSRCLNSYECFHFEKTNFSFLFLLCPIVLAREHESFISCLG